MVARFGQLNHLRYSVCAFVSLRLAIGIIPYRFIILSHSSQHTIRKYVMLQENNTESMYTRTKLYPSIIDKVNVTNGHLHSSLQFE